MNRIYICENKNKNTEKHSIKSYINSLIGKDDSYSGCFVFFSFLINNSNEIAIKKKKIGLMNVNCKNRSG